MMCQFDSDLATHKVETKNWQELIIQLHTCMMSTPFSVIYQLMSQKLVLMEP